MHYRPLWQSAPARLHAVRGSWCEVHGWVKMRGQRPERAVVDGHALHCTTLFANITRLPAAAGAQSE